MKKVTFNEEYNQIHMLITWNFAYRAARRGDWEYINLDRMRFARRIQEAATYINRVLNIEHRNNVYEKIKLLN